MVINELCSQPVCAWHFLLTFQVEGIANFSNLNSVVARANSKDKRQENHLSEYVVVLDKNDKMQIDRSHFY